MSKPYVVGVVLAYRHARFIKKLVASLPVGVMDQVIITNDESGDDTERVAKEVGVTCFSHPRLGYGGNLKYGIKKALELGADYIVDIHGDGQYGVEAIEPAISKMNEGYDFVMGSRFLDMLQPLRDDKMPLLRYILNIGFSLLQRVVFGLPLTEFHNGFRVYSKKMIEVVNLDATSNGYLFGGEIIAQAAFHGLRVAEVPVACRYDLDHTSISYKSAMAYGFGMFTVMWRFIQARLGYRVRLFSGHDRSSLESKSGQY